MAVVIQASSLQCLRLDLHTEAQVTAQLNSQDPTLPTTRWAPQEAGDTQVLLPSWPTHQLPQETQTPARASQPWETRTSKLIADTQHVECQGEASKAQRELGLVKGVVQSLKDAADQPRPP